MGTTELCKAVDGMIAEIRKELDEQIKNVENLERACNDALKDETNVFAIFSLQMKKARIHNCLIELRESRIEL